MDTSLDELNQLPGLRERIQRVVQNVPLEAFKRDKTLRAIRETYKQTQNQQQLITALDEFFIENELYRDVPEAKTTLDQVHAEDLTLIAYEVFS